MFKNLIKTIFLIVFLGSFGNVFSQNKPTKVVTGKIIDATTSEPIPGVTVLVKGTTNGITTGIDGDFRLEIKDSKAVLVFSFIGYETQEIPVGTNSTFNVSLKTDVRELEEVLITAQAKGQKNAIKQQINSTTIKNVVAADRLQENPDANAVEAIGRLPGISVSRSGGEGTGLVIRGLESKYTAVTLNGVLMPSSGGGRETNISGISQYMLQDVEVYKSNTADMEANSVAGTVNMTLRETIPGFHSNVMAQMGYNDLNNYYGNYKLQGEFSNRFLKDKLGIFFTASAERVNRSTQTMSAGYSNNSSSNLDILLDNFSLNNIKAIKYRRSAMLSLDYKMSSSTKLKLYGMYVYNKNESQSQSKSYGVTGAGSVGYNFSDNPYWNNKILQSALSGNTKLNFLNMELDYGVAYSQSLTDDPQSRNWAVGYTKVPKVDSNTTFTTEMRRETPKDLISLFNDREVTEEQTAIGSLGQSKSNSSDKNLTSYLNIKIPYKIGDFIEGHVKLGGIYRRKDHEQDVLAGSAGIGGNQFGQAILEDSLKWIVTNGLQKNMTLVGMRDYSIDNFLDNQYAYGCYYDFNKLNQITDMWDKTSQYYFNQGYSVWNPIFGEKGKIGFTQDIKGSIMDDQDVIEKYGAAYLMTEINIGKYVMFLPGVRYEETKATMQGFKAVQPTLSGPIYEPIPGNSTSASRSDKFLLPYLQLRIKPSQTFYVHLSYTKTLGRPDFNTISPNTFYNTGFQPYTYETRSPNIKPEQWTNYETQLSFHNGKIGFVSLGGFYKSVKDKIWTRSYKRIKGDPVISPFPDAALVDVTIPENHKYPVYLKGVEVDLQTSFWYLPGLLKCFTLYANYTYTYSQTQYPLTKIVNVVPEGGGRPVPTRIDSTVPGVMLYQPRDIFNTSLGFNKKGLNVWLSYQYNGKIYTSKNFTVPEMDDLKEYYNRWDLQISQKLSGKLKGLEILANVANLSNFTETQRKKGDPRPTYMEKYGWTSDLGLRYTF